MPKMLTDRYSKQDPQTHWPSQKQAEPESNSEAKGSADNKVSQDAVEVRQPAQHEAENALEVDQVGDKRPLTEPEHDKSSKRQKTGRDRIDHGFDYAADRQGQNQNQKQTQGEKHEQNYHQDQARRQGQDQDLGGGHGARAQTRPSAAANHALAVRFQEPERNGAVNTALPVVHSGPSEVAPYWDDRPSQIPNQPGNNSVAPQPGRQRHLPQGQSQDQRLAPNQQGRVSGPSPDDVRNRPIVRPSPSIDVERDPTEYRYQPLHTKMEPLTCTFFWDHSITTRVDVNITRLYTLTSNPGAVEEFLSFILWAALAKDGLKVENASPFDLRIVWPWHGGWSTYDGYQGMRRETSHLTGFRLLRMLDMALGLGSHAYLQFKLKQRDDETEITRLDIRKESQQRPISAKRFKPLLQAAKRHSNRKSVPGSTVQANANRVDGGAVDRDDAGDVGYGIEAVGDGKKPEHIQNDEHAAQALDPDQANVSDDIRSPTYSPDPDDPNVVARISSELSEAVDIDGDSHYYTSVSPEFSHSRSPEKQKSGQAGTHNGPQPAACASDRFSIIQARHNVTGVNDEDSDEESEDKNRHGSVVKDIESSQAVVSDHRGFPSVHGLEQPKNTVSDPGNSILQQNSGVGLAIQKASTGGMLNIAMKCLAYSRKATRSVTRQLDLDAADRDHDGVVRRACAGTTSSPASMKNGSRNEATHVKRQLGGYKQS